MRIQIQTKTTENRNVFANFPSDPSGYSSIALLQSDLCLFACCVPLNVELDSLDKVAIIIKKVMDNARLWQIYGHIGLNKWRRRHRQYQ